MRCWVVWVAGTCGGLAGCADLGELRFPGGSAPVRTAWYRIDAQPSPSLSVFVSSSRFPCEFPEGRGEDYTEALGELQVAACREGAHHVGLQVFQSSGTTFDGAYPAEAGASAAALSASRPRLARGAYFGVEEAFLVEVDGLRRAYSPSEETYLPDLGPGRVELDHDERLRGELAFDAGVYGTFTAEVCDANDGLLDLLVASPLQLCP